MVSARVCVTGQKVLSVVLLRWPARLQPYAAFLTRVWELRRNCDKLLSGRISTTAAYKT